jgi:deazaflavin-dependent oxidoreductase (nitroreductase family)
VNDFNAATIAEFRANQGRVGGPFEGAPLLLLHHVGRKSGATHVAPMMYLADESDPSTVYVFASKGGHPTNPDWYANLVASGSARIEIGEDTWAVTVRDLHGEERDRVYATQASRYPGFAEYAARTAGIRVIPVLALTRA